MTKAKKAFLLTILIGLETLICLLILASLAATQLGVTSTARLFYWADTHAQETIEERFTVDGPAILDLENLRGEVQVAAGEGDEYVIVAHKEAWGQGQEDAQARLQQLQVAITRSGGSVTVQVVEPPEVHVLSIVNRGSVVSFEIVAPRDSGARLRTRDGQVIVRGLKGDVQVENRFGPVQIEDVEGAVTVDARDRDVTIVRSGDRRSKVEIHNRFGELTIRELAASQLQIENRDGDVSLEDVEIGGPLQVEARFGTVDLDRVKATEVEVISDNDAVSLKDLEASGRLHLEHKFGQISFYNVSAASLRVDAQDGTLTVDGLTVEREATFETRFSAIDVSRARAQALTINGSDRDIELDDVQLEGKLQITGRQGGVRATDTSAREYRIQTRNGPIELEGAAGLVWLRNSFGDITVTGAQDVTLDVESNDGEFWFTGGLADRTGHRIDCEVGDVTLRLPSDTALWLDAQTRHGRIDNELPVDQESAAQAQDKESGSPDQEQLAGAINGGKTKLRIRVRDGNIILETN